MATVDLEESRLLDFPMIRSFTEAIEYAPQDLHNSVNQVSGTASLVIPLFQYPQVQGLNLEIKLRYSSNVQHIIHAENHKKQASWVGLGWQLGFGRIISDNQRTASASKQYYLSYKGSTEELVCNAGDYYLKQHPTWQVTALEGDGEIQAWYIVTDTGVEYQYGGGEAYQRRLLTDGNQVLSTAHHLQHSKIDHLVYAWDLQRISNPSDSPSGYIRFFYWHDEALHPATSYLPESSSPKYVRGSYLTKIEDSQGRIYEFLLEKRDLDELAHAKQYDDCYQEVYEQYQLRSIQVYEYTDGPLRRQAVFEYDDCINQERFRKSLLTRIHILDDDDREIPPYEFSYVKESSITNSNWGALEKITYPSGASISYEYFEHRLQNSVLNRRIVTDKDDVIKVVGNTLVHLKSRASDVEVSAYRWDGVTWRGGLISLIENVSSKNLDTLEVQDDFFAFYTSASSTVVFYWNSNDREWHSSGKLLYGVFAL